MQVLRLWEKSEIIVPARTSISVNVGDCVRVNMIRNSKTSLLSVLIGLGIPLLMLLIGVVVSSLCIDKEWICLLVGCASAFVGFAITIPIDKKFLRSKYGCVITETVNITDEKEPENTDLN